MFFLFWSFPAQTLGDSNECPARVKSVSKFEHQLLNGQVSDQQAFVQVKKIIEVQILETQSLPLCSNFFELIKKALIQSRTMGF